MKTQFSRVSTLGAVIASLTLSAGCEEDKAATATPASAAPAASALFAAAVPAIEPATATVAAAPPPTGPAPAPNVAATNLLSTNATTNLASRVVQTPVTPQSLTVSAALAEVFKLVQAGVAEEVLLAYITNSTAIYGIGANEIVYLNDLGAPNSVITALIQHDHSPDTLARKQAATSASPLSPGLVLRAPASNVYPATAAPPATSAPPAAADATIAPTPVTTYATEHYGPQPASVSYFHSSLAPYGSWIDVAGYGLCWRPTVAVVNASWRPYSDRGRWIWSSAGWYWYSDYSWGWAPFHYGRWQATPNLGWFWVPDTCWGPSWVSWRRTRYYCGWAPLPPEARFVSGFGFFYRNNSVGVSFDFGLSAGHYTFVPLTRFCDRTPYHYAAAPGHVASLYNEATVANHYVVEENNSIVNQGIGLAAVSKVTRGEIPTVTVREAPTGARVERIESDGQSLVLLRPQLPKDPPPTPAGTRAQRDLPKQPPAITKPAPALAENAPASTIPAGARPARPKLERPQPSAPPAASASSATASTASKPEVAVQKPSSPAATIAVPKPGVENTKPVPTTRPSAGIRSQPASAFATTGRESSVTIVPQRRLEPPPRATYFTVPPAAPAAPETRSRYTQPAALPKTPPAAQLPRNSANLPGSLAPFAPVAAPSPGALTPAIRPPTSASYPANTARPLARPLPLSAPAINVAASAPAVRPPAVSRPAPVTTPSFAPSVPPPSIRLQPPAPSAPPAPAVRRSEPAPPKAAPEMSRPSAPVAPRPAAPAAPAQRQLLSPDGKK